MFRPRRLLVPVDLSSAGEGILRTAAEMARATRGRLLLLHVFDSRAVEDRYNLHGLREEEVRARMKANAEAVLERLTTRPWLRGLRVESRYAYGLPPDEIARAAAAWKADLVVLARRRRSGLSHLLYGRTSDAVVREAPCAVLVLAS
jgi:nucleotide-binding universal stress UspA family protein